MSCTFWNMRRRLRQQLGVERAIEEEKVIVDIATAQEAVAEQTEAEVETEVETEAEAEVEQEETPKTETKTAKKGRAKKNDDTAD